MKEASMKFLFIFVVALVLAGCAGSGGRPVQTAYYDFGLALRSDGKQTLMLGGIEVQSPSWLGTTAMQYRLSYLNGTRRESYADARWTASPAELLEVSLRRRLASTDVERPSAGCRLRIDLDDFVQVFTSPQLSYSMLEARVLLMRPHADRVLARRSLSIRIDSATPDAKGGVAAFATLANGAGNELANWLSGLTVQDDCKAAN
jgi:cholesterol transport system auxiliary component